MEILLEGFWDETPDIDKEALDKLDEFWIKYFGHAFSKTNLVALADDWKKVRSASGIIRELTAIVNSSSQILSMFKAYISDSDLLIAGEGNDRIDLPTAKVILNTLNAYDYRGPEFFCDTTTIDRIKLGRNPERFAAIKDKL